MDFLIKEYKMQLDDLWTEEIRDAMVERLMKTIYSCTVVELNQYLNQIKSESDKVAEIWRSNPSGIDSCSSSS